MGIELPKRVAESIMRFTGRTWLLPKLLEWWDHSNERVFLLTGGPGTGKSMIVAWLAGYGPPPRDPTAQAQLARVRTLVKAAHFCQSASRNITPQAFAESIANQLTGTVTSFGDALAATLADRVSIVGTARAGTAASGSSLTGVSIGRIDLGTLGDELSFDRAFTQPLKQLYASGHDKPMLLLGDALDEAQTYTGQVTLPDLLSRMADLPSQVRILATTRDEPRVLKFFRGVKPFDLIKNADPDVDDVRTYAEGRLAKLATIEEVNRSDFARRLSNKASGVFLHAAMVLDELLAQPPSALPDLDAYPLPNGLSGLYHAFLTRELSKDESLWFDMYDPLLGLIAVAQGDGLTAQQLTDIVGKDIRAALRASKQYLTGELPDGPFRPFHKSFADFLLEEKENADFHIDPATMHKRVAEHYWSNYPQDWSRCEPYGLMYLPRHLAEGGFDDKLFELTASTAWIAAKQHMFHDPAALLDDLYLTTRVARYHLPPAVQALVRTAATSSQLIGTAPPLIVDTLARAGQLRRARLLAENTTFPLDRCRAMSWLAQRAHEHDDPVLAKRCQDDALLAAGRVTGSYGAMAVSFCVDAALALGQRERARQIALGGLHTAREGVTCSKASQRPRESAHLLFWTARAVRAAFGQDSPAEILQLAGQYDRQVWNLDLQIAAMVGDVQFLEQELPGHRSNERRYLVRSNLALALADAGQLEAARELFENSAVDGFEDNAKRMAWASALCDDFDHAFEIAKGLSQPEEAARALHRIQEVAQARQAKADVVRAADLAKQVFDRLAAANETGRRPMQGERAAGVPVLEEMAVKRTSSPNMSAAENWRVEAWVAHVLATAGRLEEAVVLAEGVCRRNVASVEANSLCCPTPYSADRRRHVVPQDPIDKEAFCRELASITDRGELSGVLNTCERLERQTALSAWGEMRSALDAMSGPEASSITKGWLDAVAAAARLGRR